MLSIILLVSFLMVLLSFSGLAEEASATPAPVGTEEPQGIVLDASIVFGILALAAALGVGAGYWYARKR